MRKIALAALVAVVPFAAYAQQESTPAQTIVDASKLPNVCVAADPVAHIQAVYSYGFKVCSAGQLLVCGSYGQWASIGTCN